MHLVMSFFFIVTHWLTAIHGVHLSLRFTVAEKTEFLTGDLHVITEVQYRGKYLIKEGKEVITQLSCGIKL